MLGFKGIFVNSADRIAPAWQEALSSDRPVVLEVKTDPDVAPLPPHVTFKEARFFMSRWRRGDRGAGRVIGDTARQVVDGLFGNKKECREPTALRRQVFGFLFLLKRSIVP